MTDEDAPAGKPKEPPWLSKLATLGAGAEARKFKDQRRHGTTGAASEGRSVKHWACACGWSGEAKTLKLDPATYAPSCPDCGKASGLRAL